MVKVTILNLGRAQKNMIAKFDQIKKDPELLRQIGDAALKDIVGYARSGKNPDTRSAFTKLSKSWIERREYLKRFNSPDGEFFLNSRKSNLTFTGQLLRSIKYRFLRPGEVEIYASGNHVGYKTKSGHTPSIQNEKLVEYLADGGRVFMQVSERLKKRINVIVKQHIRRLIRAIK